MENNFETYLKKLEEVVAKLENKEITLEEATKAYQEGLELSKKCYEIFKATEELIVKQVEDGKITNFNEE